MRSTGVCAVLLLLAAVGSAVAAVTVAVLVTIAPVNPTGTLKVTVTVRVAEGGKTANVHGSVVQSPATEMRVSPAGVTSRSSVTRYGSASSAASAA